MREKENVCHILKNKVAETQPINIDELIKHVIELLWGQMDIDYFAKLAESMPSRINEVLKLRGNMSKYRCLSVIQQNNIFIKHCTLF